MDITLENRDRIIALLREGTCPICGKKGLKNPLIHVHHQHGLDRKGLKDIIMLRRSFNFTSAETKEKQKKAALKNNAVDNLRGKQHPQKHDTIEKEKMSYIKKEKFKTDVKYAEKLQEVLTAGREETLRKIVRISADGTTVEYSSLTQAAKENKISISAISNCLAGRTKTCAGFTWKYKE